MAKGTLKEFIDYLNQMVGRSIYVWGGQGQYIYDGKVFSSSGKLLNSDVEEWIKKVETSATNANRVIKTYRKISSSYDGEIYCFDCSGLGTYFLYNLHKLIPTDKNANGLKGICKLISKDQLKKGDWVFRTYKSGSDKGRAYHVGYVVDDHLNIIEAKGRNYGVVKGSFDSSYWNTYGRPEIFKNEIEKEEAPKAVFTRVMKRIKPTMTGEDIRTLQKMLNDYGNYGLALDGKYGPATEKAVKAFQKAKGLTVDGKAGKNTVTALGGIWQG